MEDVSSMMGLTLALLNRWKADLNLKCMKKTIACLIFIISALPAAHAQRWNKTKIQKNNGDTAAVYSWESHNDYHFAYGRLVLLRSGRFIYTSERPFDITAFSEGTFRINKDTLVLNSDLQADNVELKVEYIDSTNNDSSYKRLSFLTNLQDTVLWKARYQLNNDTTINGSYYADFPLSWYPKNFLLKIFSLKVEFGPGFGSPWIPLLAGNQFIKVTVLSDKDFNNYEPKVLTNYKFLIRGNKLVDITGKL
jgi:hypothetical protein